MSEAVKEEIEVTFEKSNVEGCMGAHTKMRIQFLKIPSEIARV